MSKDDYPLCPIDNLPARRDRDDPGLWHHDGRVYPCRDHQNRDPLPQWVDKAITQAFPLGDIRAAMAAPMTHEQRRALDDDADWQ